MIAIGLLAAWRVTTDFNFWLYHPLPSLRGSRSALLCCVASSFPLLVCVLPRFPPAALLSAHNRFFLPWAVYYRPLAFPPTFIVCSLRFLVCLACAACGADFGFLWQQNRSKRRRGVCGDNNSCRRGNSFAAMSLQTQTTTLCLGCSSCPVTVHRSSLLHVLPSTCPGIGKGAPKVERS